ncbi:5-oxoprolinase subunit PxpA [Rasiella rasia]|uniref:5-oxoprolinase subunit PxpA n=1 Tax=Rasiella rasia TaxID=2744027 RepID=A0A6G6GI44_9FLAO|nr:5-oxoprolinase subunit PxpA [Rasiella rasia]QIE58218.1 5-oxoprolinase subunit PxpA [Rasiella rasia]
MVQNLKYIDINADVGEGIGNDADIMPYISSCNIACGGHVGDLNSMVQTIRLAKKYHVHVGAHPSFPDTDNFGRVLVTMTKSELTNSIFEQLTQFYAVCQSEEATIHHIKLHGALYNYAAKDAPTADAIVDAIVATKVRPTLYVPYNSVLHKKAENLMPLAFEAFIDRRYNDDLSLVSRKQGNAIIHDKNSAWTQLKQLVFLQEVTTVSGINTSLLADTFCIHGDHPHAVEILKYLHAQFTIHQLRLQR